ncbi:AfsR/SARP family transcriptional regulator, partial [Kitasatospora mediocidica]|uniref:AfsR/SARP family transcriptional regulator n=1 Tax=Kitasatospora mediocidica TaxID=58352 RepID=UPI00056211D9
MIEFRLLGTLEIFDGLHWKSVETPKIRSVLAVLLAASGRVISMERLVEELWYDGPQRKRDQRNLVQQYVMKLRRQLGDHDHSMLVTKAPGYRLLFEPARLDARRFDTLHAEGQALFGAGSYRQAFTVLGDALSLWRGAALDDVPASPIVRAESERLEEARLAAAEMRIDASHRTGGHAVTLAELRTLRDTNPLREGLWEKEMIALLECGRRADALEVYQRARRTLQEELGLEPGSALRDLQQLILTDD